MTCAITFAAVVSAAVAGAIANNSLLAGAIVSVPLVSIVTALFRPVKSNRRDDRSEGKAE